MEDFRLLQGAQKIGIRLAPATLSQADAVGLVREGFPVLLAEQTELGKNWWIIDRRGSRTEADKIDPNFELTSGTRKDLRVFWKKNQVASALSHSSH